MSEMLRCQGRFESQPCESRLALDLVETVQPFPWCSSILRDSVQLVMAVLISLRRQKGLRRRGVRAVDAMF